MAECSVCTSDHLEPVNEALRDGETVRAVAKRFSFPKSVIHRHKTGCIPAAEIRRTALEKRRTEKDAQVMQTTVARMGPIDALAGALLDFINGQVERGKMPNLSLVKTFLQAQEITLKAQYGIEQRSTVAVQGNGILEAGKAVSFLRERFPDALAALGEHLGNLARPGGAQGASAPLYVESRVCRNSNSEESHPDGQ